jgi:ribosome maturation protein Sdo1
MTRGEGNQHKVHLKQNEEDYIIFVESPEAFEEWKASDNTMALAQVVNSFKIFTSHKQGPQGNLETPSNTMLENDFGTTDEDEIIKAILKSGKIETTTGAARQGSKNDSIGGGQVAH